MNYYEHHIGDYAEATAHLSFVEDAAYSRLIRKYYAQEKPLPADLKAVQRLVGARTKEEKEAVETVLGEFFQLLDDGYHNTRCDEEITRYQDKQAKAKASADARWNKQRSQSDSNANASTDAMRTHSEGNAHQSPVTSHQSPDLKTLRSSGASTVVGVSPEKRDDDSVQGPMNPPPGASSRAVQVSILLRMLDVKPMTGQHPRALEWAGNPKVTDALLTAAVDQARQYKPTGDIHPNYLAPIVAELLNPPPPKEDSSWRKTNEGIDAKGRELGLQPKPRETYHEFAQRIQDFINDRRRKPVASEGAPA